MKKRGRKRKFTNKDVVFQKVNGSYGVVVDYYQDDSGHGYYRVINITRLGGGKMYGPASWRQSWELERTNEKYRRGPVTYRKNAALDERNCSCNCCIHVAIPSGELREDGRYAWEHEVDDV